VKDGIVDGIIAGNARILTATKPCAHDPRETDRRLFAKAIISDPDGARDFLKYIRTLADPSTRPTSERVVGMPANAG